MAKKFTGLDILNVRMKPTRNDAKAKSIREYLAALLLALWRGGESFGGKRPFGNSGWEWEIYEALGEAGFIEEDDSVAGNKAIELAIAELRKPAGAV